MIFSNAALQWLSEHREIFTRCFEALAPGGRLVVQVPANDHETAQVTLDAMAHEEPWRAALAGVKPPSATVAAPEVYHRMLAEIGFDRIDCYYHTFHHPMGSPAEIVEWCRATVLRRYVDLLDVALREPFVEALTARLERAYATRGPLTFNFRRLFIWAHRPAIRRGTRIVEHVRITPAETPASIAHGGAGGRGPAAERPERRRGCWRRLPPARRSCAPAAARSTPSSPRCAPLKTIRCSTPEWARC